MEKKYDVPAHLHDHTYFKRKTIKRPTTRRKKESEALPFSSPATSVGSSGLLLLKAEEQQQHGQLVPSTTSAVQPVACEPKRGRRKRSRCRDHLRQEQSTCIATGPGEEEQEHSSIRPEPSTTGPQTSPHALSETEELLIHGRSVAEYQRLYHSVVDPMLRYSNRRPRPYSLQLGLQIKQRLMEVLRRPVFSSTPLGNQEIRASCGEAVCAPPHRAGCHRARVPEASQQETQDLTCPALPDAASTVVV